MTGSTTDARAGIIGLGPMGSALADGLLSHHFELSVWNRSADKCRRFSGQGATVADSVEDLAAASDVVVVCLMDHAVSMAILETGSIARAMSGKTLIMLTTMTAEESIATAEWTSKNGISYLDGAILGYPTNIRDQACMVAYSGPKSVFDSCIAILNAMGAMPRHVGAQPGTSSCFGLAIYSTYYAHVAGVLHGAAICKAAGAPLDVFAENLTSYWDWAAEDAPFLQHVIDRDYSQTEASMEGHAMVYDLIPQLSERLAISSELTRVISGYLHAAIAQGHGDSGLTALFEILSRPDQ